MKKGLLVLAGLAFVSGCGGSRGGGHRVSPPAFFGSMLTVSIDPVVSMPGDIVLEGFEDTQAGQAGAMLGGLFQAVAGVSLKKRVAQVVADHAEPHTKILVDAFRREINRRALYQGVVDQGGHVRMRLSVNRYGVRVLDGLNNIKPVLSVRSEILLPGWGRVWSRSYAVQASSTRTLALAVADLLDNRRVETVFDSAAELAAAEILGGLR